MDYKKIIDFINNEMQFYSMQDFYDNAKWIIRMYNKLDIYGKELYKWYIYSKRYLSIREVKEIWDILNGYLPTPTASLDNEIVNMFL